MSNCQVSIRRPTCLKMCGTMSGQATVDFLLAMLVTFGVGLVILALSFTLSVVSIAQYIAFSSARTISAAQDLVSAQEDAGRAKFRQLSRTGVLGGFFGPGRFALGEIEIRSGAGRNFRDSFESTASQSRRNFYVGVSIPLTASILSRSIPLLGETGEERDFSTRINAFSLREPAQEECFRFFEQRAQALRGNQFRSAQIGYNPREIVRMEDNGC